MQLGDDDDREKILHRLSDDTNGDRSWARDQACQHNAVDVRVVCSERKETSNQTSEDEMSHWLIAATGIAYLLVSVEQFYKGNGSTGMVWAGYAFSQIGLWRLAS